MGSRDAMMFMAPGHGRRVSQTGWKKDASTLKRKSGRFFFYAGSRIEKTGFRGEAGQQYKKWLEWMERYLPGVKIFRAFGNPAYSGRKNEGSAAGFLEPVGGFSLF